MRTTLASGTLMLFVAAALFMAGGSKNPQASATARTSTALQDQAKPAGKTSPGASGRKIPCKTPENTSLCYWTHGRLSVYEGDPTLRIWKMGTHRILGVYNGPSHFPPRIASFDDDVFSPELPANLGHAYLGDRRRWEKKGNTGYGPPDIFADFEVCPLELEKKGEMQAVCIESASNVFAKNRWH